MALIFWNLLLMCYVPYLLQTFTFLCHFTFVTICFTSVIKINSKCSIVTPLMLIICLALSSFFTWNFEWSLFVVIFKRNSKVNRPGRKVKFVTFLLRGERLSFIYTQNFFTKLKHNKSHKLCASKTGRKSISHILWV